MVAWWVALSPHSEEGLGSIPRPGDRGPLCVESACSPSVCVGFLRVLRFPPTVQRHAINLQKGDDVAFHFNPRFNEDGKQVIVRNTRIKGVWGHEERKLPFFPFSPGRPFVVSVVNSHESVHWGSRSLVKRFLLIFQLQSQWNGGPAPAVTLRSLKHCCI
uniref:Galectin n=1 Tax=Pygocentrus nattereri TaxID=42514 RepID=A0AAR2JI18_PYGNA